MFESYDDDSGTESNTQGITTDIAELINSTSDLRISRTEITRTELTTTTSVDHPLSAEAQPNENELRSLEQIGASIGDWLTTARKNTICSFIQHNGTEYIKQQEKLFKEFMQILLLYVYREFTKLTEFHDDMVFKFRSDTTPAIIEAFRKIDKPLERHRRLHKYFNTPDIIVDYNPEIHPFDFKITFKHSSIVTPVIAATIIPATPRTTLVTADGQIPQGRNYYGNNYRGNNYRGNRGNNHSRGAQYVPPMRAMTSTYRAGN